MKLIKFFGNRSRKQLGENLEGNALEALIGAIYLEKGFPDAQKFVFRKIIKPHINLHKVQNSINSYKDVLLKWGQKNKKKISFRHHLEKRDKEPNIHHVTVFIDNDFAGRGWSTSKKKAEEMASKNAYKKLNF